MGFFDLFKKKKERTLYDELMDIPGMKEQIELFEIMSEANKGGCTTDEMPEGIGEFGLVPTNPIPVNTIQGSILYLGAKHLERNWRTTPNSPMLVIAVMATCWA